MAAKAKAARQQPITETIMATITETIMVTMMHPWADWHYPKPILRLVINVKEVKMK